MASAAELALKISAQDLTGGALDKVGKQASGLGSALGGVAKIAAGVGVAFMGLQAVQGVFGGIIDGAMEAERVMAATNAVIASTKGAAGMSAAAVADLASSFSKMTAFDDEAIQSAENMLLTFTSIGKDVFPAATETVLNMSEALGQDLKSSAIQLGKALNDPIEGATALRRVGVALTDAQEEQIKAFMAVNDIASAQGIILKELETEFGGAAKAAGSTMAGQMKILETQIGNVKETIGAALLPILSSLLQRLMPLITVFGDWLPGALTGFSAAVAPVISIIESLVNAAAMLFTGDFQGGIFGLSEDDPIIGILFSIREAIMGIIEALSAPVGDAIATIKSLFDGLADKTPLIAGIGAAILSVLVPAFLAWAGSATAAATATIAAMVPVVAAMLPVIATAALVGAAVAALWLAWDTNFLGIRDIVESVVGTVTSLLDKLAGVFTGAEGAGLDLHNMLEGLIGIELANWIIAGVQEFQKFADEIGTKVGPAVENVKTLVSAFTSWLRDNVPQAFEYVQGVITDVMSAVLGVIKDHWDQIKQYIDGVLQIIQGIITIAFGLIRGIITMALAAITGDWDAFGAAFEETWRTLWEGIKNILSGALDIIQSVLSLAWDAIQAVATIAWDAFKTLIQAVWDALLVYITSQIEKLKADLSSAWETINSTADTAWNLVRTTVENVWKALQKAIDEFLETIQTNIETVWTAIQTTTAEVWQAMRNKIDEMIKSILGIFEGYIKAINGVIGAVGGLLDWISKIPSFVKMPDIQPGNVIAPPGAPPGTEPTAPPEEVMEGVARALGIGAMSLRAFGAVVDSFKTKLKELIEGIAALAGEMNDNPMTIISAKAFSEGVLPIVDFVSKATSALIELRKVRALTIETFDALREGIKGVITALASLAGGWEGVSPDAILGAKAFAQAVGPAFEAISKAIDILGKLKDYTQIGKAHVTGFINNVVEIIEQLVEIAGAWDDGILEMVKVFTGVVGPAIADIGKGFELLEKLKDYSQIGKEHARGFINNLVEIVDHLAEIAGAWSVELQDSMALISETIGKVVSGIAPGIELLAKLKDYSQIGQVHIQGFINNLVEIIDLMAGIAGVWERELQEKIQLISDTIDKIASGLESSLDMFEKLKDYSQIAKEHAQGLVNNLVELMDLFAGIANVWPEDLQEKIKKLLTTMDEIVDTLIKASGLKDLTPMTEQVLAFRDAIVALLQEVGAGFTAMVNEVRLNLVALADAFSESVTSAWAWSTELVKAIDDVVVALAKLPVGALVPSTATPLIGTPGGGYTTNSVNNSSVVNIGAVNMSNNNNIQEAILMMNLLAVPRR